MKRIIYQAFTRLWGNGRLSDWDNASLKYLRSLGVDYVWFTGIPRHARGKDFVKGDPGSPYSVSDWMDTNPYFASDPAKRMDAFESLVRRTHRAGLKVLIDYIPNHVAKDYKGKIKHFDYCDGDWTDTLKNDWSAPETYDAMLEVLRFWASKGVDGFRCDMVELVPADKLGSLVKSIKAEYPELLFVAEVYGRDNYRTYLDSGNFDLLYDKCGLYDSLVSIYQFGASARQISLNWQSLGNMQSKMLNFLENHDEKRLTSEDIFMDTDKSYAALACSLLFNTASFMLYFGQEVGESASESENGRTSIFNWSKPKSINALYDYIHKKYALDEHESKTLERYREILRLANTALFKSGSNWDIVYCNEDRINPERHFAFMRYDENDTYLVVCNFSAAEAKLNLRIPEDFRNKLKAETVAVTVPAFDYTVCRIV